MKRTPRGFAIYTSFKDTYKNTVRVQESSSAMINAVWIITDPTGPSFKETDQATPHLNKRQAQYLIKALTKFVERK